MTSSAIMSGRVLAGKYELGRMLGQGGMGAVYEARNHLGKRVAVKMLLKAEFAQDPQLAARFFREAQASAAIESKHIVDVYDSGVDDATGNPFIIMELLNGEDLEHVLRREGALDPMVATRIISQGANGLAKAHEAGIIHRDIKPGNLFLVDHEGERTVKLLDFGIAKASLAGLSASGVEAGLTSTGALLGTPLYMSPEQAQSLKTIDGRSDVWSLGMCLYQCLTGRLPYEDVDTIGKLIVAIVSRDVPAMQSFAPWVPAELAAVVHHALARDVAARIGSARQLVAALAPFTGATLTIHTSQLVRAKHSQSGVAVAPDQAAHLYAPTMISTEQPAPSGVHPGQRTTAATSVATANPSPEPAAPSPSRVPLFAGLAVLGVALAGGGIYAATQMGKKDPTTATTTASVSKSVETTAPSPSIAETASTPPVDVDKVGILDVKIPAGCTVKVGGVPQTLVDGKLTLRGQYNQKFVVGVYDKSGKRIMSQEVYLYDGVLDPPVLDTKVGEIYVKPGAKPSAIGATTTTNVVTPPSAAPTPSTKTLPAGASSDF